MINNLLGRGLLKVLDQFGDLIIVLLLGGTHAADSQALGILSQSIHALRAKLVQDARKQVGQLLALSIAADDKGVGRNRSLD
jgi:hypothetical protein